MEVRGAVVTVVVVVALFSRIIGGALYDDDDINMMITKVLVSDGCNTTDQRKRCVCTLKGDVMMTMMLMLMMLTMVAVTSSASVEEAVVALRLFVVRLPNLP